MTSDNTILIAQNVPLTFKTVAKAIYISNNGEITLWLNRSCDQPPTFSVDYLEYLCCKLYFAGKPHRNAIADMLLLNNMLHTYEYGDFYRTLNYNLTHQNISIVVFQ